MIYPPLPHFSLIKSIACGLALLASGQAFAAGPYFSKVATGNFNDAGTWETGSCSSGAGGGATPTATDDVTICSGHTVTVDANAVAQGLTVSAGSPGGTLNFSGTSTLTVGANGIKNSGTFNAGAGAIAVSATTALTHGVYNNGTFTMGSGTLDSTATQGVAIDNDGTFVGGTGLITATAADGFRNGFTNSAASFTVGSGGMTVTGNYMPNNGTILLNGNVMIVNAITAGVASVSGAGKMILTDAAHGIAGNVNVHNLETAAFTAARTITLSGTVTATGTTKLNGSAAGAITLSGGTFTPATTAYYCATSSTTNVTCNALAPPLSTPVNAPVDLHFSKQVETFATEIDLK
jgi:hypothetical protein